MLEGRQLKVGTEYDILFKDGSTHDLGKFTGREKSNDRTTGQQSISDNIYKFEKMPQPKIINFIDTQREQIDNSDGKAVYTEKKLHGGKKRTKNRRRNTNKTTRRKKKSNRIKTNRRVQSSIINLLKKAG